MSFLILHTNDFHNKLTPEKAERIRELKQSLGDRCLLLLDAGDAISAGNLNYHLRGEPILDLMNACGYDAMTLGNREFHFTKVGLRCKIGRATFPILCANLYEKDSSITYSRPMDTYFASSPSLPLQPAFIRTAPLQQKVLVVGLTVPMITARMASRSISAYLFENPLKVATEMIPRLQAWVQPDLTIALTHIGVAMDRRLAASVPTLDLIIGGHTHELLPQGEWVGDTLIVQAGCYARHIGYVEWDFQRGRGEKGRLTARVEAL
ncbi:bifunctional metallophosphatase/5'-nucleotidase [Chthonomonas calidirosea]|uniref:bifunctional metallophosphatase/5'-nucleotidase n=1 Tax=Chthonomonas calidirosea TaxID=454171 RepID=UPI0006ECB5CF|nr:metallophosphatase [Chthonomonas calidirosea]CEK14086.1 5'-nucleotidase/2',3'-cyclic phosphodiesterase-like hydrolase [Chthonomonas calidirosea]